jgi:hypothetical protein
MLGGPNRRTLFIVAAEWRGIDNVDEVVANRSGAHRTGARAGCEVALGERHLGVLPANSGLNNRTLKGVAVEMHSN